MAGKPRQVDRRLQELYRVAPKDFVRARNALAARLREESRTSEAAEVSRLRKPTPAVWTVNQLARREPEDVGKFLEAVDQLKRAHFREAGDIAQATERHRVTLQNLIASAKALLTTAGVKPSPEVLQRLSSTLVGAAADPSARSELLHGRLAEEREAPGFDAFTGAPAPRPARPADEKERRLPTREALRASHADLRERRQRVRTLEQTAAKHQRAAEEAIRAAQETRQRLAELERRAREERAAAEQASQAAQQARQDAERAAEKGRATGRT